MRELEKLLEGVEVEWKPLGEVAELKRGKTITAKTKTAGNIPVISGGQQPAYYNSEYNRIDETITVAGSGAYAGFVMFWNEPIFVSDAFSVKPLLSILNTRYVFHFLLNNQEWIHNLQRGSGVPHVYPKDLAKLQIPIPSLTVQKEIVRILDTFTELTAELKAELTARKQQYSYYRDQLLSFEEGEVEWKSLGEIITLQRGKRLVRSQLEERGEYAVYQNAMTPLGYYHESNVLAYTTFVICAGAAGEIGFSDVDYWAADDVFSCITPDNINDKYLYYYLLTQRHKISSQVRRASIPRLSKTVLEKLKFPIPSLDEQERIVSILDKFDTLTNSISEGLPKEIELRKKQYEYYRDLLLTFPKQESA